MPNNVVFFMIAKQHSSRLPGKNRKMYNGLPMYIYTLKKMAQIGCNIYFNSDSDEMLDEASSHIPNIFTCKRPLSMCDQDLPSVPLFQFIHNHFELEEASVLNVQANSPSITTNLISDAVSILKHCKVSELLTIYPDTRMNNGSLWGFSSQRLLNYGDPYVHKPNFFISDASIDIHTQEDFEMSLNQSKDH